MSNKTPYDEAKGYAFKLDSKNYKDIVHDAYVRWYNKTGKNIFTEHRGVITKTIKNIFMENIRYGKWVYRGQLVPKEFIEALSEVMDEDDFISGYVPSINDVEVNVIVKDLMDALVKILSARGNDVLQMMSDGYRQTEIAEKLNISDQLVSLEVKKIKKYIGSMINNPFNGSKTKVVKQISESRWSKRKDYDDFEFEDINETVKLYVHKESGEGWLIKLTNPIHSEDYVNRLENRKN